MTSPHSGPLRSHSIGDQVNVYFGELATIITRLVDVNLH